MRTLATLLLTSGLSAAHAHEGHGLLGTHWHASDVWGFIAVAGLVGLALWRGRK